VAFPLQAKTPEVVEEVARLRMRHGHAVVSAQLLQDLVLRAAMVFLGRLILLHVEREMGQAFRRLQLQERA